MKTLARIVEGDAGKAICKEAERLKPAAVVMGTRGRSLIQRSLSPSMCVCVCIDVIVYTNVLCMLHGVFLFSVLQGSVSEYCFHNCKTAPIIIVPGKGIFVTTA